MDRDSGVVLELLGVSGGAPGAILMAPKTAPVSSGILGGTLPGYFSPWDPQGPPRARELEILLTCDRRS